MNNLQNYLILSAALFCIGIYLIITRKNAIVILMGIELMLNAANINLVAFSRMGIYQEGQLFTLFVITVAVAETAIGLAIILKTYRLFKTTDTDSLNELKN